VTRLDPHDTGAFGLTEEHAEPEGLWDDLDVNELHPDYQCSLQPGEPSGVCSWEGVGYHDNYWRDQDDLPCLFDPDGKIVPGASDFNGSCLNAFCHSDVHAWYHFTVDTETPTHPLTGDRTLFQEDPAAISDWQCFDLVLQEEEIGAPVTLEITVSDDGLPPAARSASTI